MAALEDLYVKSSLQRIDCILFHCILWTLHVVTFFSTVFLKRFNSDYRSSCFSVPFPYCFSVSLIFYPHPFHVLTLSMIFFFFLFFLFPGLTIIMSLIFFLRCSSRCCHPFLCTCSH